MEISYFVSDKDTLEKIRKELIATAKEKKTIFYEVLARKVRGAVDPDIVPDWFHIIGGYLYEINRIEKSENRPMISALVITMDKGLPGYPGFWDCAKILKFWDENGSLEAFWKEELERVWDYWSKNL